MTVPRPGAVHDHIDRFRVIPDYLMQCAAETACGDRWRAVMRAETEHVQAMALMQRQECSVFCQDAERSCVKRLLPEKV